MKVLSKVLGTIPLLFLLCCLGDTIPDDDEGDNLLNTAVCLYGNANPALVEAAAEQDPSPPGCVQNPSTHEEIINRCVEEGRVVTAVPRSDRYLDACLVNGEFPEPN